MDTRNRLSCRRSELAGKLPLATKLNLRCEPKHWNECFDAGLSLQPFPERFESSLVESRSS